MWRPATAHLVHSTKLRVATEHSRGVLAIFALLTHLVRLLPAFRLLHRAALYATRAAAAAAVTLLALVALCSVALHAVTARAAAAAGRLLALVAARATAVATSLALLAARALRVRAIVTATLAVTLALLAAPCYLARCARRAARAVAVARRRRALHAPAVAPCALARRERVRCLRREEERQDGKRGKTVVGWADLNGAKMDILRCQM